MHTDTSRHDAAAHEEARAEALRNSDEIAEWLTGACYLAKPSAWQPVQREKTAIDYLQWSTPDLVALLFDQGQPAQITRAVRDVLADRYCAQQSVADSIAERSLHIALQMTEDERFPEAA